MNAILANRFTTGIMVVVFAGFWLALSACLPNAQSLPRAWKPISIARAFGPSSRPAHAIKEAADSPNSDADLELAKVAVPSDASATVAR